MDFSTRATRSGSEEGRFLALVDTATRKPFGTDAAPVGVTLAGMNSSRYMKSRLAAHTARVDAQAAGTVAADEPYDITVELLAGLTISWSGIEWGGVPLDCNYANAVKLYREVVSIRDQVDNFVATETNFFAASSTV